MCRQTAATLPPSKWMLKIRFLFILVLSRTLTFNSASMCTRVAGWNLGSGLLYGMADTTAANPTHFQGMI